MMQLFQHRDNSTRRPDELVNGFINASQGKKCCGGGVVLGKDVCKPKWNVDFPLGLLILGDAALMHGSGG
jgi:hypothetical protein